MRPFASLSNRIFFATAALAVLSIGAAIYIVNRAVTRQAEDELHNGLNEASTLVAEYGTLLFDHFANEATLVADLPKLKAAVDTNDPLTVRDIARGYQQQLKADFLLVTRRDRLLARFGAEGISDEELMHLPGVVGASSGRTVTGYWPAPHGVLQVLSVPILIDRELAGTLVVGASLDSRAAARFKRLTSSDIAFASGGRVQASTLPEALWPSLGALAERPGLTPQTSLDGNEFIALTDRLSPEAASPVVIILRSRSERLRFLRPLHTLLGLTALVAVFAATLLSYAIARTVTRPLGTITATMREMAATGDLTRRIPDPAGARWQDEDAQLLASTFNAMTDSIQRFQREAAQRERLSSLGRLSTVVAHEIRNPLMIIKAAVRTLRREDAKPAQVKAAAGDIDEEISRLNRIVSEVLDFARPIKFDLCPADVNALAADAARAAALDGGKPCVRLDLDARIPSVTTDAERLRQVLLNVLGNAVQAVEARGAGAAGEVPIRLTTSRIDGGRFAIVVRDRGIGIAAEDLPKVFDPYFTTRRTGTGIGLAISRNIVEGLGGRISVTSQPEGGTEVRIELPIHSTTEEHGQTRTSRA